MLDNKIYNLMHQLVQENKSLWRIKNEYITDTKGCDECLKFWKRLEEDKEKHVAELMAMIKKRI